MVFAKNCQIRFSLLPLHGAVRRRPLLHQLDRALMKSLERWRIAVVAPNLGGLASHKLPGDTVPIRVVRGTRVAGCRMLSRATDGPRAGLFVDVLGAGKPRSPLYADVGPIRIWTRAEATRLDGRQGVLDDLSGLKLSRAHDSDDPILTEAAVADAAAVELEFHVANGFLTWSPAVKGVQ